MCSKQIDIAIEDGIINDISFTSGCEGNLRGLAALAKGRAVDEVIPILAGITCNLKPTSCPDQLAKALSDVLDGSLTPADE